MVHPELDRVDWLGDAYRVRWIARADQNRARVEKVAVGISPHIPTQDKLPGISGPFQTEDDFIVPAETIEGLLASWPNSTVFVVITFLYAAEGGGGRSYCAAEFGSRTQSMPAEIQSAWYELSDSELAVHWTGTKSATVYEIEAYGELRGQRIFYRSDVTNGRRFLLGAPVSEADYTVQITPRNGWPADPLEIPRSSQMWVRVPPAVGTFPSDPVVVTADSRPAASATTLLSWGPGRLDGFASTSSETGVAHIWHQAGQHAFLGWEALSSRYLSPLSYRAASVRKGQTLDVFALDDRGALVTTRWRGGRWANWTLVATNVTDTAVIAAASCSSGRVDVLIGDHRGVRWFFRPSDDADWEEQDPGVELRSWRGGRLRITADSAKTYRLFGVSVDGDLVSAKLSIDNTKIGQLKVIPVPGLEPLESAGPPLAVLIDQHLGPVGAEIPATKWFDVFMLGRQGIVYQITLPEAGPPSSTVVLAVDEPAGLDITSWDPPYSRARYDCLSISLQGDASHYWSVDGFRTANGPEPV